MSKITSTIELKNAIHLLEVEHAENGQLLKEQYHRTYEGFRPSNILKRTLKDLTTSPSLIKTILGTFIGLGAGYLAKKIVTGISGSIMKKILGSILQRAVTKLVFNNSNAIASFGKFVVQHVFHKQLEERRKNLSLPASSRPVLPALHSK